ncbi:MAG: DUF6668 family protein [Jatrophihabitantaceae bacterium]
MTTFTSGVPRGLRGIASAPAGVVTPPPREAMLGWRREQVPSRPQDQLWLLGVHGGAGVSTLRRCLDQAGLPAADAGRAWPIPDGRPVLVVARTHGRGIKTAQAAAQQYLSGHTPPDTVLLGCVLVPDGPGKLPRAMLAEIRGQVSGIYAETLAAPWAEEYRLLDPDRSSDWPPPPAELSQLAARIDELLNPTKDPA